MQTKLSALLSELGKVRAEDAGNKSLIFSQFKPTLDFLQTELPK